MNPASRRHFLKITALAGTALGAPALAGLALRGRMLELAETRTLMGTIVHLTVVTPDETTGRAALEATFGEMERLITIFDHRRRESPLARLNRAGELPGAPGDLLALVAEALRYGDLTGGAFDVTVKPVVDKYSAGGRDASAERARVDYRRVHVTRSGIRFDVPGMAITLDGIAKGYVVDGGVATLKRHGFTDVVVEAGGDLLASGQGIGGDSWRVGIAHPRPQRLNGYLARFSLRDQAVATSGDYLNAFTSDLSLHHIIDPRTGTSPAELASVSVVAPSATAADALSTALMVTPLDVGIAIAQRLAGVEALFVTKDLDVRRTAGFPV